MHSDLVGTARFKTKLNETYPVLIETLQNTPMCDSVTPSPPTAHLLSLGRVAPYRAIDSPPLRGEKTVDKGNIAPLDAMNFELGSQSVMGLVVLGGNHHPGGIFIEAVHNSRPQLSPHPRKVGTMVKQGIDKRPPLMARGRMHNHPGSLIYNNKMGVLIKDGNRDILG